jgi:hypothetical protein
VQDGGEALHTRLTEGVVRWERHLKCISISNCSNNLYSTVHMQMS